MTREQWQAIKTHNKDYDGTFFYALKNSRIVCRPSCPRRKCLAKNVIIYGTLAEALGSGCTICSRCRPDLRDFKGPKEELANAAEQLVRDRFREKFSLTALADTLHVDKSYLLRTFREVKGTTLLAFHNKMRCDAAAELLTRPELSISYIASEVGFISPAHFSKLFKKLTGCTPSEFRSRYFESLDE